MTNRVILGTAKLGLEGRDSAFAMLDAYLEMGGRHIDTANVYSDWVPGETGRAEKIIGEWLKARGDRGEVVIATKGAHPPIGHMERPRCDAASIRHDVDESLRRLGVERIDLWYFHRDDPATPVAEIVGPVQDLIAAGKVAAFGVSNWSAARIAEVLALPGPKLAANQPLGNILCRVIPGTSDPTHAILDAPMLRQSVEHGHMLDLFTSQASGTFERRKAGKPVPRDYAGEAAQAAAARIEAMCAREGLNVSHVALAFLTGLAPNVRALIGPRNAAQLRETYAAGDLKLPPELMAELATVANMAGFLAT